MKKIVLVILFIATTLTISAQRLGFMGGFQLTNAWALAGKCDFNAKPGPGFTVGALFEANVSHRLGIEVGALYNMRHTTFDIDYELHSDTTVHMARTLFYLDIPVHLYVNFPLKNATTMSLFFGPSINVGLHGQDIAWENTEQKKPVGYDKDELFGKDNRLMRLQFSGELGLAVKHKAFEWRASYNASINNMTQQSFLWYVGLRDGQNKYLRDGNFKLTFAYMFDLRK
ncbi:MAG: porin family protein [Bacteroidales bacterium]|nr:porin family protein [Bacteroidales bacterium]